MVEKKPRIIVLCFAYNSQEYIEETMQSVLDQTYDNFVFVIGENGSTDNTRSLIKQYIDDPRIVYIESDYNSILEPDKANFEDWTKMVNPSADDYFTTIDSDDFFGKDALQKMADIAEEFQADVVFAGCNMFDEYDRSNVYVRKPQKTKFYPDMRSVGTDWISMYGSIRVRWGNLYRYDIWNRASKKLQDFAGVYNGGDTLQNILTLDMINNLATLSEPVINYRIRHNSIYHTRLNPERYKAYDYIRNESVRLLQKWSCTDGRTYLFVEQCRESAMYDLVNNLTESHENYENNCKLLYNILTDTGFVEGLEKYKQKDEFFKKAVDTIKKNGELISEYRYENFGMMLIYGIVKHNPWLFLAGLFHVDNVCQWGASYIKDELLKSDPWISKIFPDINWAMAFKYNRSVFIKMLTQDYASVAEVITSADKTELQNYMEKEHDKREKSVQAQKTIITEALETGRNIDKQLEKVLRVRLLDKEVINYTLLYDINKGNAQRLLDTGVMIRYVYCDDPDMLYMAALAFEYLNMPENAVECLGIAVKVTDDSARREEFQAEISRLEEMV